MGQRQKLEARSVERVEKWKVEKLKSWKALRWTVRRNSRGDAGRLPPLVGWLANQGGGSLGSRWSSVSVVQCSVAVGHL